MNQQTVQCIVTTQQVAVALNNICQRAKRPNYPISTINAVRAAINGHGQHILSDDVKAELRISSEANNEGRRKSVDIHFAILDFVQKNPWTGINEIAGLLGSSTVHAASLTKQLVKAKKLQLIRMGKSYFALPGVDPSLINEQRVVLEGVKHGSSWGYKMGCRCIECFKCKKRVAG